MVELPENVMKLSTDDVSYLSLYGVYSFTIRNKKRLSKGYRSEAGFWDNIIYRLTEKNKAPTGIAQCEEREEANVSLEPHDMHMP